MTIDHNFVNPMPAHAYHMASEQNTLYLIQKSIVYPTYYLRNMLTFTRADNTGNMQMCVVSFSRYM